MKTYSKVYTYIYIVAVLLCMTGFTLVFNFWPRPAYSAVERRELAQVPAFSWQRLWSGQLADDISHWYSDTEPFRDQLMTASMTVRGWWGVSLGDDVRISAPVAAAGDDADDASPDESLADLTDLDHLADSAADGGQPTIDENARLADAGVIVVGSGPDVRALMAYGGSARSGLPFARACRLYQQRLAPLGVQVYAMPVPLASEFYTPQKALRFTRPQRPAIDGIFAALGDTVLPVDAYRALQQHTAEAIYLRTDHHWAPLGAYYAAEAFARVAKVPFQTLDTYETHTIHRYVGTMYGYSKDIAVKNAPEDFVYYTPTGVSYTTWFTPYSVSRDMHITAVGRTVRGPFFASFKDGSSMAYCTFMGGDMKLTEVHTSTPGQRRLLIVKDSYGNAVPGYLFHSFSEVHVADFRYCHRNLTEYVRQHAITDLLFAFNIFNVSSSNVARRCLRLLTQPDGQTWHRPDSLHHRTAHDSTATPVAAAASVTPSRDTTVAQPAAASSTPEPTQDSPEHPAEQPAQSEE
ncbi:MAG: hypothetical protein K5928_00795 [Prevotella sp.]|nr:hypothetical protein [Prevotella sp.]